MLKPPENRDQKSPRQASIVPMHVLEAPDNSMINPGGVQMGPFRLGQRVLETPRGANAPWGGEGRGKGGRTYCEQGYQ